MLVIAILLVTAAVDGGAVSGTDEALFRGTLSHKSEDGSEAESLQVTGDTDLRCISRNSCCKLRSAIVSAGVK